MRSSSSTKRAGRSASKRSNKKKSRTGFGGAYKVMPPCHCEYGDGGSNWIDIRVIVQESLGFDEQDRADLKRLLLEICDKQKDVQPNGFVHDIIDPSLNARMVRDEEVEEMVLERLGEDFDDDLLEEILDENESDDLRHQGMLKEGEEKAILQSDPRMAKLRALGRDHYRAKFQWIPADFVDCNLKTGSAFLDGDIPGLEKAVFGDETVDKVSELLEKLFSKMVLLLGGVLATETNKLQVVIKAQQYVLPPHSTYTGKWHTEGFSENIVAGGVYYVDIDEDCVGGDLQFAAKGRPDDGYVSFAALKHINLLADVRKPKSFKQPVTDFPWGGEYCNQYQTKIKTKSEEINIEYDDENRNEQDIRSALIHNIPVKSDTAIVFSNQNPHRFKTIRNETDKPLCRLFVNFFVVDPNNPLPKMPSKSLVTLVLGKLPEKVAGIVLEYLGFAIDKTHATIVRDKAREQMSANPDKWGSIMYGNAGEIKFLPYPTRSLEEFMAMHQMGITNHPPEVHSPLPSKPGSGN